MMKKSVPDKLQNEFCGGDDDATAVAPPLIYSHSLTLLLRSVYGVLWIVGWRAATDPFPPVRAAASNPLLDTRNLRVFRSVSGV
ncbi:hypothetical protein Aduo_001040 [Ancylostoma duodenale]